MTGVEMGRIVIDSVN